MTMIIATLHQATLRIDVTQGKIDANRSVEIGKQHFARSLIFIFLIHYASFIYLN